MQSEQDVLKQLGLEVKRLRESAGLSQEELAFISGLHRTYIGMIERAEKNITVGSLLKICEALGVSLADVTSKFNITPQGKVDDLKRLRGK